MSLSWVSADLGNVPLHSPHLKDTNTPVFGRNVISLLCDYT